jgi:hypothetical protein
VRSRDGLDVLRALVPIAWGHASSVGVVAAVVALGLTLNLLPLQVLSGVLLGVVALWRASRRRGMLLRAPAGRAGLALWSFAVSTAHGTGMMLLPALIPLCVSDSPAREITASGSLLLALAAVGVHMLAMLAVTGLVALGAWRGFGAVRRRLGHWGKVAQGAPRDDPIG